MEKSIRAVEPTTELAVREDVQDGREGSSPREVFPSLLLGGPLIISYRFGTLLELDRFPEITQSFSPVQSTASECRGDGRYLALRLRAAAAPECSGPRVRRAGTLALCSHHAVVPVH